MSEAVRIDALDEAIINGLQGNFPICEQAFAEVAGPLGLSEEELLVRVQRLLDERVLTRFGPMFQVERMGGAFVLAAMRVPDRVWEEIVTVVNNFPEVAHNYRRESDGGSDFNMWFVLATETPDGIAPVVQRLERATGLRVWLFPKEEEYFVEMKLPVRR